MLVYALDAAHLPTNFGAKSGAEIAPAPHVASMAWGARKLISTQALLERGHHLLKVDTEGADLLVLRGAGSDALRRYFRGVVIECAFGDYAGPVFNKQGRPVQPPPPAKRFTHHTGECNVPAALAFMRDGFPHQHVVVQGGTANVFFGRAAEDVAAMKGLLRSID